LRIGHEAIVAGELRPWEYRERIVPVAGANVRAAPGVIGRAAGGAARRE
jgi:hypothetical protein